MGLLSWIIVGGLAGWIASMIMKTDAQMGIFANIVVGIVGALIGGFVVGMFGVPDPVNGFNIASILVATLGAVILLGVARLFQGRRA